MFRVGSGEGSCAGVPVLRSVSRNSWFSKGPVPPNIVDPRSSPVGAVCSSTIICGQGPGTLLRRGAHFCERGPGRPSRRGLRGFLKTRFRNEMDPVIEVCFHHNRRTRPNTPIATGSAFSREGGPAALEAGRLSFQSDLDHFLILKTCGERTMSDKRRRPWRFPPLRTAGTGEEGQRGRRGPVRGGPAAQGGARARGGALPDPRGRRGPRAGDHARRSAAPRRP